MLSETLQSESPLQWLVAFDDDHILLAITLLSRLSPSDHVSDTSWNHPSIDLLGRFPVGTPLHSATFMDNGHCVEALLLRWPALAELADHPKLMQ
jgi:hypothetical protein